MRAYTNAYPLGHEIPKAERWQIPCLRMNSTTSSRSTNDLGMASSVDEAPLARGTLLSLDRNADAGAYQPFTYSEELC